ncbi:NusG domain II-containing protein [Fuchsiella alkaliacetigena]|uniref:NusG domain II-containing protein n=1 Tax=Fuchsiella alkaliacetigena TaxID=957042 RepID=UPI00200A6502|nr:NusG domain II-containing protein [Fuchsiella alkaliacetigena]MCK8825576.1 NusG domain II-containing protein [Fuchsiella alkaliacetigena]
MFEKLALNKVIKLLTLADKVLIIVILLAGLSLMLITPRLITDRTGADKYVVVTIEEEEVYRHRLVDNEELEKIDFDFTVEGEKYQGVLKMKNGRVRLDRLNREISPLPIHYEMGWISESYESIISLPVRMIVTIETVQEEEQDIDAVNF